MIVRLSAPVLAVFSGTFDARLGLHQSARSQAVKPSREVVVSKADSRVGPDVSIDRLAHRYFRGRPEEFSELILTQLAQPG